MRTFFARVDGQRVRVHLYSLTEYEADGGIYSDAGNQKGEFLAALTICWPDGAPGFELSPRDIGSIPDDYWLDTMTGYWLIKDFPPDAPLAARMLES